MKTLLLLSMDKIDEKEIIKRVLTPSFSVDSLLGLNAFDNQINTLEQESIFKEQSQTKRAYVFKFPDIAEALKLQDKTKQEFFTSISRMFSKEEIRLRMNRMFEILSSSKDEYVVLFSVLFMNACNEILDYIQSKQNDSTINSKRNLQLTLPGYN